MTDQHMNDPILPSKCLPECEGIYYSTQMTDQQSLINNTKFYKTIAGTTKNENAFVPTVMQSIIHDYLSGFGFVRLIFDGF